MEGADWRDAIASAFSLLSLSKCPIKRQKPPPVESLVCSIQALGEARRHLTVMREASTLRNVPWQDHRVRLASSEESGNRPLRQGASAYQKPNRCGGGRRTPVDL